MTWQQALDLIVSRTGHERYRVLCRDEHPDHKAWRREMVRQAGGEPEPETSATYPSVARQAWNASKAAGQFMASGFKVASQEEQARRLSICKACPHYDAKQKRCVLCGCVANLKVRIASMACPDKPPRW